MGKILSISVAAYNVENYLQRTLESCIVPEIIDKLEIIIVNDGSADRTMSIAKKYVEKYPNSFKVIDKKNGGHGSTINTSIEVATAKYYRLLDGDDWIDTASLKKYIENLTESDSDVILTPFRRINDATGASEIRYPMYMKEGIVYREEELYRVLVKDDFYQIHSITVRTEIVKKIPKISHNCYYVDQEFNIYTLTMANSFIYYNFPIYVYRVGREEQSVSMMSMIKHRNEHKSVIFKISTYIYQIKINQCKKKLITAILCSMSERQEAIYVSMRCKQGRDELELYTRELKKCNPDIYNNATGIRSWILRLSRNHLYYPLAYAVKLLKMVIRNR